MAAAFVLASGRSCIGWLSRNCRETIRQDSPRLAALHAAKAATPTMGGLLILGGFLAAIGLFADFAVSEVLASTGLALGLGLLGICDDLCKARTRRRGLSAQTKLVVQSLLAIATIAFLVWHNCLSADLISIVGGLLLIVGLSNAVNLTDGLDGLASGCSLMVLLTILLVAGATNSFPAIALPCASLAGGVLGFMWFNRHPARVFMGDTGSLPLGGLIGLFVLLAESRLSLLLACGVFLVEAASVVLQVGWFKSTGRRLFLCAPLHHHFQFLAWPEQTIVRRFWLAGVVCALIGLAASLSPRPGVRIAKKSNTTLKGGLPAARLLQAAGLLWPTIAKTPASAAYE